MRIAIVSGMKNIPVHEDADAKREERERTAYIFNAGEEGFVPI